MRALFVVSIGAPAARLIVVLAAAMLAITVPASAQQTGERLPDRLGPATRAAIERVADSLRSAGLPDDPVYSKAAEGVLKGADDARILLVVRSLAHELSDARQALGSDAKAAEIVAGASALHAGVPSAELRRMRDRQPRGSSASLAVPLTVMADLITRGVPANDAAASVNALLTRRVDDAEFQALRVGVERDITAGRPPGAAAQAWTERVLRNVPPAARQGVPRSEIPR
ncbi:MAG TPA: hypothetical protein VIR34_12360 [Gemmatimonadaceae bacterium]|jgi:hypothetical protein